MVVSSSTSELVQLDETLWEIPAEARADMRVPARIFADPDLDAAPRLCWPSMTRPALAPSITPDATALPPEARSQKTLSSLLRSWRDAVQEPAFALAEDPSVSAPMRQPQC